jgi:flagellar L-ring protein precursor FlgH
MRASRTILIAVVATGLGAEAVRGQSSSIRKRYPTTQPVMSSSAREETAHTGNALLEERSLIAVAVRPPRKFKVHDLVTIIVRQQRKFESDGSLETKKKFEIQSELDAFIKFVGGGVGAAAFRRGHPNIDYKFDARLRNEADKEREDRLTTRLTAEIVDVKPNGNLVVQARGEVAFEDELSVMTLTGTCRGEDITPDNTVLSTQIAELKIVVTNSGAVRDGSRRGWITRLLDILRPF